MRRWLCSPHDTMPYSSLFCLEARPKLNELTQFPGRDHTFSIPELIGTDYTKLGIALLDDVTGKKVKAINLSKRGEAAKINLQILTDWLGGKGISDITWGGLIKALKPFCHTLAEDIEAVMQ